MMLSKEQLKEACKCRDKLCYQCLLKNICKNQVPAICVAKTAQTALYLLNRLETAETILRDVLASGNVKSCEKEIEGFLREAD